MLNGLQLLFGCTAFSAPTTNPCSCRLGLEYNTTSTKAKVLTNCHTLLSEASLTYLAKKNLCLGANMVLDAKK